MDCLKKIKIFLSYFWPQTTKIESEYSGVLELTYVYGKKVLDSKNANYSYGSLQKILKQGILSVGLSKMESVLLLGLGGGCVLQELSKYKALITAVEWDKKIIEIAEQEFKVTNQQCLTIIHEDAFTFMQENNTNYNLIIVDLFIDNKVPTQFYTQEFCTYLYNNLTLEGGLIFNLGMDHALKFKEVIQFFKKKMCAVKVLKKVQKTNTLLIVNKS